MTAIGTAITGTTDWTRKRQNQAVHDHDAILPQVWEQRQHHGVDQCGGGWHTQYALSKQFLEGQTKMAVL